MSNNVFEDYLKNFLSTNAESGYNNDVLYEPDNDPKYDRTDAEKVIAGANNAFIVLGRDRFGDRTTGYGGKGHHKCGAIDIVVGRLTNTNFANVKEAVNPNPFSDAARLYLSQKSDIDKNYNLPEGLTANAEGISAALLKADAVRLVSRDSFKIVTNGEPNLANDNKSYSEVGLQIISKASTHKMQPMVLGENLTDSMLSMCTRMSEIVAMIQKFLDIQKAFNETLANHNHISAFYAQPDSPSPDAMPKGKMTIIKMFTTVEQDIKFFAANLTSTKTTYLTNPTAPSSIVSSHHFLN